VGLVTPIPQGEFQSRYGHISALVSIAVYLLAAGHPGSVRLSAGVAVVAAFPTDWFDFRGSLRDAIRGFDAASKNRAAACMMGVFV
jgi:hypothetical protein